MTTSPPRSQAPASRPPPKVRVGVRLGVRVRVRVIVRARVRVRVGVRVRVKVRRAHLPRDGSPDAQIAEANLEKMTGSVGMGMPCSVQCSR